MQSLRGKKLILISLTLFSMFFGAGNLIFPPFLGAQAGHATWYAMGGFLLSAVGFPILGVVAVARCNGLRNLAGRVHPLFSQIFTLLIYLSIGPCLAIPRTASTSFEMLVTSFYTGTSPRLWQLLYSILFFAVALIVALKPEKLTNRLGKILCPCLIGLIVIIFIGCIINPVGAWGAPLPPYDKIASVQGFLDGYQTMDTIAALNFGIIIAINITALGIQDRRAITIGTIRAGLIAGGLMVAIYSMLAHIGSLSGGAYPGSANGAQTLTKLANGLFGSTGNIMLSAIFIIACLNTCIGLISCCSEYFHSILPKWSYRKWVLFFTIASMIISNAGLTQILKFSVPVLNMIYPLAIVLILLSFFPKVIQGRRWVYPMTALFTGFASVMYSVMAMFPSTPFDFLNAIPLAKTGLGWLLFSVVGLALGCILPSSAHQNRSIS